LPRPEDLERRLGHRFADPKLLEQALTHGSRGGADYQRLEFLGDGVLGCVVAGELYARFPRLDEGKLSQLRSMLVREASLAEAADALGLGERLKLGAVRLRPSLLADALEALFGAVFLDGGYAAARGVVLAALGPALESLDPEGEVRDPKTRLQELVQARYRSVPRYRVTASRGAAHERTFEVECRVEELSLAASGSGSSRRRAEQDAAAALLRQLAKA
jgi:ribonuclease-3